MDSNTHSTDQPDRLGPLEAAKQALATEDLGRLTASALSEDTVRLRRLLDGLEGEWLRRLATLDACGAAGADQDQPALSTASWLRNRQRMGTGVARGTVRTARALFRGPLKETAAALTAGDISLAHAREIAEGTRGLPEHVQLDADLVLAELAGRLDPPDLRRAAEHLRQVADPEGADRQAQRHHERRGLWLAPTLDDMVAVKGLLEPEAGTIVRAALEALARPADAGDDRSGDQRTADALAELARRSLEGGGCPRPVGSAPSCWSPWTSRRSWATAAASVGTPGGWGRSRPRPAAAWPATAPSPGSWSTASPPAAVRPTPAATMTLAATQAWPLTVAPAPRIDREPAAPLASRPGSRRGYALPWPGCPRPWVVPRASPWTWVGPPGWCRRPSARPWPCVTGAVSSQAVIGPWPGATRIICGTGSTAARPTSPTSPCYAGLITGPSMRGAGS